MRRIWIAFVLISMVSCETVRVLPLADYQKKGLVNQVILYNLPQNQYHFEIKIKEEQFIPGEFSAYSTELLGIKPIAEQLHSNWSIKDLSIDLEAIPDSNQYYAIENPGESFLAFPSYSGTGLLLSFNGGVADLSQVREKREPLSGQLPMDVDQSEAFVNAQEERVDTSYKYIDTDTASFRVPVLRKSVISKSTYDKAVDVSKMLLELRAEKYNLLMGDENEFPDGKAFEIAFDEYQKIENQYLPLFTGKRVEHEFFYQFTILPDSGKVQDGVILGFFNDQKGFSNTGTEMRDALILNFELINSPALVDSMNYFLDSVGYDLPCLYTRIPALYRFSIRHGNKILSQTVLPVAQLGRINRFPIDNLLNDKTIIEFYPETGSIKRVYGQKCGNLLFRQDCQ